MKPSLETLVFGPNAVSAAQTISGIHAVADYRLYRLDGVRKVSSAHDFAADDDDAAIEAAKSMYEGYECELWKGPRLVARLDLRPQS
jgi:hypothetical protein